MVSPLRYYFHPRREKASGLIALFAIAVGTGYASADTKANYSVALSGSMWGSPFNSNFEFEDGMRLSGLNMNFQGNGFTAGAGDVYANWDNLGFAQRSYRGLSLGVPVGKVEATLIGGSIVTYDDLGRERNSPIYGVRAALPLSDKLGLTASQLYSDDDSRTGRSGDISSLGLKYQFSKTQKVGLEAVRSDGGSGWQLTGESKGKRLGLRASYRQTDTGFSRSGNPFLRTNRNGGFLNLSYRLSKPLTFSTSTQRYNDGGNGGSSADTLRLQYSAPKRPQLAVFLESRGDKYGTDFYDDDYYLAGRDNKTRYAGFEVAQRFKKTSFSLRYSKVDREGSAFSSINGSSNLINFRISQQLDKQTRLSFTTAQDFGRQDTDDDNGATSRGFSFLNLEHRLKSGASVNAGLQYQTSDVFGNSGNAVGIRTGFSLPVGNGTQVGIQYQRQLSSTGGLRSYVDDRIYFSYSRNFDAGKRGKVALTRQQRKQLSQLDGGVYEDSNGNGHWDTGERGVPGIALRLRGDIQATTDQNGRFKMVDLDKGDYQFKMQTKTLPIELTTASPTDVPIQLGAGQKKTLEFAVMKTGQISGVVFNDTNRNGRQDEGETPITEAVVQAEGSQIIGFSDDKGRFTLTGLPPRQWRVFVDTSLMVGDLAATNKTPIEVDVPANGDIKGIQLGLGPVQKAVVNNFVKIGVSRD